MIGWHILNRLARAKRPFPEGKTYAEKKCGVRWEDCPNHYSDECGEECWYSSEDYWYDCGNGAPTIEEIQEFSELISYLCIYDMEAPGQILSYYDITGGNLCWICEYHNCGPARRIKHWGGCIHPLVMDPDFSKFTVFECYKPQFEVPAHA